MAKEKKFKGLKVLGLVLAGIIGVGAISGALHRNKEETKEEERNTRVNVGELYELGIVSIDGSGEDALTNFVGKSAAESTLKITGGAGTIKAAQGGGLVFENLTIEDATTDTALSAHDEYLSLGGKLLFKNCVFTSSIYIEGDADTEFIGCTFTSPYENWYSVWVGDGSARFKSCLFTGYRGMKIHEFEDEWYTENGGEDVARVEIEACEFLTLSKKPGLVIGTFTSPENTTIVVKSSIFTDCAAGDSYCKDWIDGYYESDTDVGAISFYSYSNKITYDGNITWH